MDGGTLEAIVADFFTEVFDILTTTRLFEWNGRWITLWSICIFTISLSIFRDFLDIMGVWSYSSDDLEFDSYERD